MSPARIAVFTSGGGTNLQALIDRFNHQGTSLARVELVIASRAGIGALTRAAAAGIPSLVFAAAERAGPEFGPQLLATLVEARIDLLVLAGYVHLIPEEVVERFRGGMLNVHPALLPAFGGRGMYGDRVHRAVLASGALVSGATVHLVDERYDEGAIVAQWPVPVLPGDTPETLAQRVLRVEHLLLPAAVEALLAGAAEEPLADPAAFALTRTSAPDGASLRRLTR